MNTIQSSNIILYCKKHSETVKFYRDILGLPVSMDMGWLTEFKLTETSYVSVADEKRASVKSAGGLGVTIALKAHDADHVFRKLKETGIPMGALEDFPPDSRRFFIHDPEGNRIEIWSG